MKEMRFVRLFECNLLNNLSNLCFWIKKVLFCQSWCFPICDVFYLYFWFTLISSANLDFRAFNQYFVKYRRLNFIQNIIDRNGVDEIKRFDSRFRIDSKWSSHRTFDVIWIWSTNEKKSFEVLSCKIHEQILQKRWSISLVASPWSESSFFEN
jgi:hypothetical protein